MRTSDARGFLDRWGRLALAAATMTPWVAVAEPHQIELAVETVPGAPPPMVVVAPAEAEAAPLPDDLSAGGLVLGEGPEIGDFNAAAAGADGAALDPAQVFGSAPGLGAQPDPGLGLQADSLVPDEYDPEGGDGLFGQAAYTAREGEDSELYIFSRNGKYRLRPYGIGWVSMSYDLSRTVPGEFVLFVASDDDEEEPSFTISARQSRLGLDVAGPDVMGLATTGRIEIDFMGAGTLDNFPTVLLRHAYGEFKNDKWRFIGGQTWDIVSPLLPNTVNFSAGWAGGNVGFRRPQVRAERFFRLSDESVTVVQFSLNQTVADDFVVAAGPDGEDGGWPDLQTRVGVFMGPKIRGKHKLEAGISGAVEQEIADFTDPEDPPIDDDVRFMGWLFAADCQYAFSEMHGLRGEYHLGENIGAFLGGINQGVNLVDRKTIQTSGGWAEYWVYASDSVHFHMGGGIDDPLARDLAAGQRNQNHFFFGNMIWEITKKIVLGAEISYWKTQYIEETEGETVRFETAMKYFF